MYFCCCYYLKSKQKKQEVIKMENKTVNYSHLVKIGFPKSTSQQIIRQAKIMMVKRGYTLYANKRLGNVPIDAVEEILGFKLLD